MTRSCFLIDFENVQPKALQRLVPGSARIKVFLGQHQTKLALELVQALQPFGKDADYIQIDGSGPDAVDFHIAFYIGEIATKEPGTIFRIISKDKGFDPLVKHLTQRGIDIDRLTEIPLPAVPPRTSVVATKSTKTAAPSPAARQPATVAVTTKARTKEAVARLKKSTRPTKLTTLRSSLMSWYEAAWGEKSVDAVLQSLQDSKVVTVTGAKVTYNLG